MLDNMPRLRLSDDHLKFILWILKDLDVPDVPSFKAFRRLQSTLDNDINITTIQNVAPSGNVSYSNSLISLIAMVKTAVLSFAFSVSDFTFSFSRITPIPKHDLS